MPHQDAGIRYHCAFAVIYFLLSLLACPLGLTANDVGAADQSETTAAVDPDLDFQNAAKSLMLAERPGGSASSRGAKGRPDVQPPANQADMRIQVVSEGTSSRAARKAGLAAMPLNKLTAEGRQKAQQILNSASIFRELPTLAFEVEPAVYQFFLMHPDIAVSVWRAMGVSEFKMWQTGPVGYEADVGDGTVGLIDVLYRSSNDSVVICNGVFNSPLLVRPIKANALMHLQTEYRQAENGRKLVQHKLRLFVDFPSTTVETAAKIVTPVTNLIVDRNFHEVSLFLHMMSLAMTKRPDWVQNLAGRLDGVLEPSKAELVVLTAQIHSASLQPMTEGTPGRPEGRVSVGNGTAPTDEASPKRVATTPRPAATR